MKSLTAIDYVAFILVIVGGVNWGLVGALNLDLVALLFGDMSLLARVVYGLVGIAAVYTAIILMQLGRK